MKLKIFFCSLVVYSHLYSVFTTSPDLIANIEHTAKQWARQYLTECTPADLQLIGNFIYFSHAQALADVKIRKENDEVLKLTWHIRTQRDLADNHKHLKNLKYRVIKLQRYNNIHRFMNQASIYCSDFIEQNKTMYPEAYRALNVFRDHGQSALTTYALTNNTAMKEEVMQAQTIWKQKLFLINDVNNILENITFKETVSPYAELPIVISHMVRTSSAAETINHASWDMINVNLSISQYAIALERFTLSILATYYHELHQHVRTSSIDDTALTFLFNAKGLIPQEMRIIKLPEQLITNTHVPHMMQLEESGTYTQAA